MSRRNVPSPRIGTSGWHYKHWVGRYYPAKTPATKMLGLYLQDFDTVELNNTFYRLPTPEMARAWASAVPEDFLFAVKGSRFITHNLKLKNPQNALDRFFPVAELLGKKLGPILFQTPPQWRVNVERLETFLSMLPRHYRCAFELREPSWMCPPVFDVLRKYNAALCIYEIDGYQSPLELTADWTYVRLHGPGGKYQGSYSDAILSDWSSRLLEWQRSGVQSFLYFDNDDSAYAVRNAMTLKRLVMEVESRAA